MTELHDTLAERAVLGSMMLSADIGYEIAEILNPGDFYQPKHATIYDALLAALIHNHPVDAVAIAQRLADRGQLAQIDGAPYLHDLLAAVDVAASAPWHAKRVLDLAQRRRLAAAAVRIHQHAIDLTRDTETVVNDAQAVLHNATTGRGSGSLVAFGDGLDDTIAEICDPAGADPGLSTGIGILDDAIGGLKPGQLVIIGGRPGMGKSVLAVDMIRAVAIRKHLPTLVVSLEMSVEEIRKRVISAELRINLFRLLNGKMFDDEKLKLHDEKARLGACPMYIERDPHITLAGIRSAARRMQQREGLALIVVDYLQLMTTGSSDERRDQQVGAISRGLKLLARELGVPVIAAAQLNRESTKRNDKRPDMADLRESGSIEADADIVILLHRPDYNDPEHHRAGEIDLIIAKNRNGPQDCVTAAAQLEFARIVDMKVG